MLDRRFIRENRDLVTRAVRLKRETVDVEAYYDRDAERRAALQETETLQAESNRASKEIAELKKAGSDASAAIAAMKQVAERLKELRARTAELESQVEALYLRLPNVPDPSVPEGGEEANQVVRTWGEPRRPDFAVLPHWDVGAALGILELERAARMSGSGFTALRGDGARLEWALVNWFLDENRARGYTQVSVPYLVGRDAMTGTGQLPKLEEDMYVTGAEGLFLIPTAEVPVTNLHREETLPDEELPLKYCAFSPCFRREAGAAGKDTRGLLRVHQFHKVELVKFTHPDRSWEEHESLTADAEHLLQRLELPYRVVLLAAGDLSFAAAKCYDLEVWSPGVGKWLEVSSCSNFLDFQARRASIRYKGTGGRGYVHTLNGSALALPRVLVAILENYQQRDGRVRIPEVLRPGLDGREYLG
ncbi:MAG: serine--tRNA ligase [Candidatus Krumholzibacteriia bacterium]